MSFFLYFLQGNAQSDTAYIYLKKKKKEKILIKFAGHDTMIQPSKKIDFEIFSISFKKMRSLTLPV